MPRPNTTLHVAAGDASFLISAQARTRTHPNATILRELRAPRPCHGDDPDKWYKNASVGGGDCGDHLARVEFGEALHAFFVFRPWAYSVPLAEVLETKLGLRLSELDALVCNEHCGLAAPGEKPHRPRQQFRRAVDAACPGKKTAFVDFGRVRATLQKHMLRDAGRLYGATNARYADDGHPCLPGLPDDEVDHLFAVLADGAMGLDGLAAEREAEFWKRAGPGAGAARPRRPRQE